MASKQYIVNGVLVQEIKTRQYIVNGVLINEIVVVAGGANPPTANISGPLMGPLGGPI